MATELTLKDESVVKIGEVISSNVRGLLPPPKEEGAVARVMTPFESMIGVLEDIRDGIHKLVDRFSDSVSIQQQQLDELDRQDDISKVQATEEESDKPGFLDSMKDKAEAVQPALEKAAFAAGLLALAFVLQKYSKQIAAVVTPIIEGVGKFIGGIKKVVGVLVDEAKKFAELTPEGGFLALPLASYLIRNQFLKLSANISAFFTGLGARYADIIKMVTESKIFTTVKNFATSAGGFFSKLGGVFKSLFGFFLNNPFVKLIFSTAKVVGNLLRGVPVVGQVIQAIIGVFSFIKGAITGYKTDGVMGAITGGLKGLFDGLIGSFLNLITGALSWIADKLGLKFLSDFLSNLDFRADSLIKFFTETLPGYFSEFANQAVEKFKDILTTIKQKVTEFKDKIVTGIKNFLIMLKDKITAPFVGIVNAIKGAAGALVDKIPLISDERKAKIKESLGLTETPVSTENGPDYQMDAQGNIIDKQGNVMTVDEKTGEFVKAPIESDTSSDLGNIETDKRNDGKQINTESAELGTNSTGQNSLQIVKGGSNSQSTVQNSYLSYDRTTTSDNNFQRYLRT